MSKLTKYKFSDLYEMSSGISSSKEQAGHGSPFISFSTVFNNYFLPEELPDLMDTSLKEQEIFSVKKDDVFITRTSETVDALAMSCVAVKDYPKATFSGFVKRLRPKTTGIVYSKYIAFFLRSKYFRKVLDCNTIMTLRASFNEDMFSFLYLYLPDYEEQVRIGDLLYKMEMKIRTNNKINREFCCCTKEVQNRILEYCDLDLRVSEYNIYEKCLVAIESVLNKRFPDDKSVFYDGGKYFTRSLEYYADKPIPHQEFEYQNHITDVLANAFNSNDKKETPIQQLSVEYSFGSCKEIEACQLVTVIAEFAAIYGNKNKNIDKSYGSPGGYDGEVIETMEDLFLLALFEIYTNCVL